MHALVLLPEEVLCLISDFVYPQTVIDWACACKVLSRCSLGALEIHKQRRPEFRVVHDRNPITIPSLLRRGLSEPGILWYIRSLDIWDLREKFEEWKSPNLKSNCHGVELDESLNWPEKLHDYSCLDKSFYKDQEIKRYTSIMSDLLHLKQPLVYKWMNRLLSGSDEPLKVLLMAMSPKLTKVTFVEYGDWQFGDRSHPLRMLSSTLRALVPLPAPRWPFFQSLKIVNVGIHTQFRGPQDSFYLHSSDIAPLFLLPVIEELYIHWLMDEDVNVASNLENEESHVQDPQPYIWEWEVGRSSCQKLSCTEVNCCKIDPRTTASFIGATHSLRYLSSVANDDEIVSTLLEHSKHSLETLSLFESMPLSLRCGAPYRSLQPFQKLTNLMLEQGQLIDLSTYKPSHIEHHEDHSVDLDRSTFGTTDRTDLLTYLPPTLQTLAIDQDQTPLQNHEIEGLMHQLVALVKAKLDPANGAFTALRGICLGNLSMEFIDDYAWLADENRLDPWTGDLRRVCEEADVKLHAEGGDMKGLSQDASWCISCMRSNTSLDSDPEMLRLLRESIAADPSHPDWPYEHSLPRWLYEDAKDCD